jgi:UDP-N-acetylmuramate dehydrogenase
MRAGRIRPAKPGGMGREVTVREQVALAGYTTLGLGGPAARFIEAGTDQQLIAAVEAADRRREPVLVLGGGSNLVVADAGFPGTVVKVATRGITAGPDGGGCAVTVAAGEDWDAVVSWCVSGGLSGIECLSGIPGLAGATPIQNVGAYGQEVAQTVAAVRAYDRESGGVTELTNAECGFGYRTSAFKRAAAGAATGRFVVLGVTFRLARDPLSGPVRYAELARSLGIAEGSRVPLGAARAAVLGLRRAKGMVLDRADPDTRSAGSFFTNPVLDAGQFAALEKTVAAGWGADLRVPRFAVGSGQVKVPAAWLIERAGFGKGYSSAAGPPDGRPGRGRPGPRISTKHTLALVNPGGASTTALLALAREITDGVRETFGVQLVNEPVLVGAEL